MSTPPIRHPADATAHLTGTHWARANRHLVRKAIAEFAHELLLEPLSLGSLPRGPSPQADARSARNRYRLESPQGVRYDFDATPMALRHWHIDAESIRRTVDGAEQPLDALAFVTEFRALLGLSEAMLPIYLEEISSTLYGAAFKRAHARAQSAVLADADFQTLESAMTEGHPGFVANNGRLGFDAHDYRAYAPEAGSPFQVIWLAVHREQAHFACLSELHYERFLHGELGAETLARFTETLEARGLDAAHYTFMPSHPWQWFNKLAIGFAADIALGRIVCLGCGSDRYAAQQSIRTFFNLDRPDRCYVKTSLSIVNMGFMRGLSPYYMAGTPAINEWLHALVERDPCLREHGFGLLREVASIGFRNRHIESAVATDTPYKKMLSALWRESPMGRIAPHERLMTMAALLHTDDDGRPLLPELIRRSGLDTAQWLQRYLRAYLTPLVHCFYAHDLVFMPHGENLILVLDGHVPVRVFMKDIAEESAILDKNAVLPEGIRRLAVDVPEHFKLLAIFIDVFDGFFRHMSPILVDAGCCTEEAFWSAVAGCIADYQEAHPELAEKFARHDLFAPEFLHSCLNRLQLANNLQMVNLADPASSLRMAGMLPNPIAALRPARAAVRPARAVPRVQVA